MAIIFTSVVIYQYCCYWFFIIFLVFLCPLALLYSQVYTDMSLLVCLVIGVSLICAGTKHCHVE